MGLELSNSFKGVQDYEPLSVSITANGHDVDSTFYSIRCPDSACETLCGSPTGPLVRDYFHWGVSRTGDLVSLPCLYIGLPIVANE